MISHSAHTLKSSVGLCVLNLKLAEVPMLCERHKKAITTYSNQL